MIFKRLLENNVKKGTIYLHMPGGKQYRFGHQGPEAHWVVNNKSVIQRIARDWEFELGETYINGGWHVLNGELRDLLSILRINFSDYKISHWLDPLARLFQEWNKISRSYLNAASHYDLDEAFFRLFLDQDMHYSCAYFSDKELSLEQAQQQKCKLIATKLLLQPGQRVLDIGCGWGSLAFYLAQNFDVEVTGITLSKEQLAVATREARSRALDNVVFKLKDYRELEGNFDRVVSVGMFEHVGKPNYQAYFRQLKNLMHEEGVALVHTIGRSGNPKMTNPWIRKHIFPGGSIPALSEMSGAIEGANLMMTDIEILRLHYAWTLQHWQQRLHKHRDFICKQMGDRFYRMWDFYLTTSEISFLHSDLVVFQVQLAQQHGSVPVTRDYLYENTENSVSGELDTVLLRSTTN